MTLSYVSAVDSAIGSGSGRSGRTFVTPRRYRAPRRHRGARTDVPRPAAPWIGWRRHAAAPPGRGPGTSRPTTRCLTRTGRAGVGPAPRARPWTHRPPAARHHAGQPTPERTSPQPTCSYRKRCCVSSTPYRPAVTRTESITPVVVPGRRSPTAASLVTSVPSGSSARLRLTLSDRIEASTGSSTSPSAWLWVPTRQRGGGRCRTGTSRAFPRRGPAAPDAPAPAKE